MSEHTSAGTTATAEDPSPETIAPRSPKGYVPTAALAGFGLYTALLTPIFGGLSVKIQDMVGLADAPALLGIVTGAGAVVSSVVQPIAGRLSDRSTSRFGMRRPFILFGAIGVFFALIGVALASNFVTLLLAWCLTQAAANFALAANHTTLADQVPEARRGGVSGIIGATTPAAILGGALVLAVAPNDFLRFVLPAAFGLLTSIIFVIVLKDRVRTEPPTTPLGIKQIFGSFLFDPRKAPDFGWAWLSKALILLGYGGVSTYLTLFLGSSFGMDTDEQLQFNAIAQVVGIATLVVFSVVGGYLSDKLGRRKPFVLASGLVIAAGVLLSAASPSFGGGGLAVLLVAQAVIGAGAGTFFAVDQALCISLLPNPEEMGKDLGILNLAGTIPGSIAPLLAGVLFIPLGNALFGGGYTLWFSIAAAIAVIGSLLVLKIKAGR
ncbi:MFS transporter [Geodermatophilaceae bacterium NBWT11]|nr:MFS transporter [Geodermatophilaceae bacterium NBWT11]